MLLIKTLMLGLSMSLAAIAIAEPVNVNKASAKEIAKALKGIGDVKASAIVSYREKNGEFTSPEQLKNIGGIGKKVIAQNRDDILLK